MPEPAVRRFDTARSGRTIQFGDREVFITPAITADEGGPLSAYSARFARGERADLPAPYEEIWVVLRGRLQIHSHGTDLTVGAGQYLHVPEHAPGQVEAMEDTTLVCVSVPAH